MTTKERIMEIVKFAFREGYDAGELGTSKKMEAYNNNVRQILETEVNETLDVGEKLK